MNKLQCTCRTYFTSLIRELSLLRSTEIEQISKMMVIIIFKTRAIFCFAACPTIQYVQRFVHTRDVINCCWGNIANQPLHYYGAKHWNALPDNLRDIEFKDIEFKEFESRIRGFVLKKKLQVKVIIIS